MRDDKTVIYGHGKQGCSQGAHVGKRIIGTLVIVAIVLAAAPPLFGIVYENQVREQIASAPEVSYMTFELADYRRGFYSSQGQLRFALSDEYIEQMRSAIDTNDPANPQTPEQQAMLDNLLEFMSAELLFDIDVQHGPVMTADGISMGLATVHSEIDSTAGKLAEIQQQLGVPYLFQVDAQVDFDGSFDFQAEIPPIANNDPDYRFDFSGLNYTGYFDRPDSRVTARGGTDQFLFEMDSAQIAVADIGITMDSRMLSSSLWLGKTSMDVGEVHLRNPDSANESFDLRGLGFDADVGLNDTADKLAIAFVYRIADVSGVPDSDISDLRVGMRLRDIDREAIEDYLLVAQQLGFADPDAMEKLLPELQTIGTKILRGSPGVDLNPFEFVLNGEPFTANIGIDFDGTVLPADIDIINLIGDPGVLIEALSGAGQIASSESLARTLAINILRGQIAQGVPPDAEITAADIEAAATQQAAMMIDGMIQQGLIQRKNDQLNMDISYADGQLFVNNVPVPLGQ